MRMCCVSGASEAAVPALFLDRDGVINEDTGYAHRPEDIVFLPGIFRLVATANGLGMPVIVVTNQAGIARGYYSEESFHALMDWMKRQFLQNGARLDAVYHCPHHPQHGLGAYKTVCSCRKPAPGMLLQAAAAYRVDMPSSVLIGDKIHDVEAAIAAGVGIPLLLDRSGSPAGDGMDVPQQAQRIHSLDDARKLLLSR